MILVVVMILVDFGNAFWLCCSDEGEKTPVGCGDDFGWFRLILVVLEYGFRLILFDYFIR
jgi:hypothetical protein